MIKFPTYIDRNIVRSVAITTFVLSLLIFLSNIGSLSIDFSFILLLLFVDFLLRYIHPKFSPNVYFHKLLNYSVLKNEPKLSFSPPKRFAILIGLVITGLMVVTDFIFIFHELFLILNLFLLLASFLQAFYDYCLGCEIYDLLLKLGIKKQPDINKGMKLINSKF
jgi:hypothetical protein